MGGIREIESLSAGPEMDALVAEILGYDVLGITHCLPDPECFGYYLAYKKLEDWRIAGAELRPVYLEKCACEFTEPGDRRYFGHIAGCLEIVEEYSLEDRLAFQVVDWLVEQDYHVVVSTYPEFSACEIYEIEWKGLYATVFRQVAMEKAQTRPLAICRALLSLYKHKEQI